MRWSGGFSVLLTGWMGAFVLQFAWFANWTLVFGNLDLVRGKASPRLLVLTLLLTASAFLPIRYPLDEGGVVHGVICDAGRGAGFWLWTAANAVLAAGLAWLGFARRPD